MRSAVLAVLIVIAASAALAMGDKPSKDERSVPQKFRECSQHDRVYFKMDGKTFSVPESAKPLIKVVPVKDGKDILGLADYVCEHTELKPINALSVLFNAQTDQPFGAIIKPEDFRVIILEFGKKNELRAAPPPTNSPRYGCSSKGPTRTTLKRCYLSHLYDDDHAVFWEIISRVNITDSQFKVIHKNSIDYIKNLETK